MPAFAASPPENPGIALEATNGWHCLYELMEDHRDKIALARPLKTRTIEEARIKTDTTGATILAHLPGTGPLPTSCLYSAPRCQGHTGVPAAPGIDVDNTKIADLSPEERQSLVEAIKQEEFWKIGTIIADDRHGKLIDNCVPGTDNSYKPDEDDLQDWGFTLSP